MLLLLSVCSSLILFAAGFIMCLLCLKGIRLDSLAAIKQKDITAYFIMNVLVIVGLALHALKVKIEKTPISKNIDKHLFLAKSSLILVIGTLLTAWVQFELYWEYVYFFPILIFIGTASFFNQLGMYWFQNAYQTTLSLFLMTVVGIPFCFFITYIPMDHFTRHGSKVVSFASRSYTKKQTYSTYDSSDPMPTRSIIGTHKKKWLDGLSDIGKAKLSHETPSEAKLITAEELLEKVNQSRERAKALDEVEYQKKLAAWKKRQALKKVGGRLFSGP